MVLATLLVSGRDWLLPAAGFVVAGLALLLWAYWRARADGWVRVTCVFLKLLGLLALAACLLEPLWTGQRARPGANYFVVLADNSQSLQIRDRNAPRSRGEFLRSLLAPDKNPGWQAKLEENFQVRRYQFDSRLQPTKDFGELSFDGRASAIGTALRTISDRFKGQPLAGVLLLTDGNATDLGEGSLDLPGLPPIYPVSLGTEDPIRDLAIDKVAASQTAFEDAPVTVQVNVAAIGYAGEQVTAQLLEVGQASNSLAEAVGTNRVAAATNAPPRAVTVGPSPDKLVAEQTLPVPRDGEPLAFRFQVRPARRGLVFYRVRVAAKGAFAQFDKPGESAEAILGNNVRLAVVDRGAGPYRILYVAGRPNWEYKFLNRAVADDAQLQLVALLRIAKREPKFDFRGRPGESSNPLFRGFDGQPKEETERYDQPVLIRLNVRDEAELRSGFPKTPEDLYAFHAVVVDDVEAGFFTTDQLMLLQKFVSERGGGFLMLGGTESFQQGKFARTLVGDMMPVYLDGPTELVPAREWRLLLEREGWLTPWARLRQNESDEQARLDAMPTFQVLNRVRGLKPGASLIASAQDGRGAKFPALAVQRFGHGRTAALMIGDLWRWGLRDEAMHRDMDKAWRQFLRWLVTDTPERIELQVEARPGDPNQAVVLEARAHDKKFQPLDNASVAFTVRPVGQVSRPPVTGGQPDDTKKVPAVAATASRAGEAPALRLTGEPALNEAGLYEATYVPRETGAYQAEAIVTDASGIEVGRAAAGWSSDPAADEFRSLKPNRALLETLAKRTGGEIVAADKLEEFARVLPSLKVPITESWSFPLWHQAGVFAFALLCFLAEWGLRRLKGLA
jgi:uncharacterized membrane protein